MAGRRGRGLPAPPPLTLDPDRLRFGLAAGLVGSWATFLHLHRLPVATIAPDELAYQEGGWRFVNGLTEPALSTAAARAQQVNADNFEHPALGKLLYGGAQRLAGQPSLYACRALAAVATLALAALVGWWTARLASTDERAWSGRWAGLGAAAMVALLPAPVEAGALRIGRYAYLDPLASLAMVAAVVAVWRWARAPVERAWPWALLVGVTTGLAAGIKVNAALGVVGPVLLVLARDRRHLARRCAQVVAAVAGAGLAFVLPYLHVSQPLDRIAYLLAFQRTHGRDGHVIGYAGRVRAHPDWWANLWFAADGWGAPLTVALLILLGGALALRRDRSVAWCVAMLIVPLLFHLGVAQIALPFYWTAWTPAVFVLAALGLDHTVRVLRHRRTPWAPTIAVLVLLAAPAGAALGETARVARLRPTGPAALAQVRGEHGLSGTVLSTGVYEHLYLRYLPDTDVRLGEPSDLSPVDTVVVGATRCRNVWDRRRGRAIVAVNLERGALRRIYEDSEITVYEVVIPLVQPTEADVAAQPPVSWERGC